MSNKKKKSNKELKVELVIARLAFFTALIKLIQTILEILFK